MTATVRDLVAKVLEFQRAYDRLAAIQGEIARLQSAVSVAQQELTAGQAELTVANDALVLIRAELKAMV